MPGRLVLASPLGSDEHCVGPPLQGHPVSVRSLEEAGTGVLYGPFTIITVERNLFCLGSVYVHLGP